MTGALDLFGIAAMRWFRRLSKRIRWSEAYSKVRMRARWERRDNKT
jgi:hypothetical protein